MGKPIIVECPECNRKAEVYPQQEVFVCKDKDECGFQINMKQILGFMNCVDGQWYMTRTEWI